MSSARQVIEAESARSFILNSRPTAGSWLEPLGLTRISDDTWRSLAKRGKVKFCVKVVGYALKHYTLLAYVIDGDQLVASEQRVFRVHGSRVDEENLRGILRPAIETFLLVARNYARGYTDYNDALEFWKEAWEDVSLVYDQEWSEQAAERGGPEPEEPE